MTSLKVTKEKYPISGNGREGFSVNRNSPSPGFNFPFSIFHEYKHKFMNLSICWLRTALRSAYQTTKTEKNTFNEYLFPPAIPLPFTCRESPGGRPSVAPDSWVSPYLYRSNQARLSACVARRSPHSDRGRRAGGG